MRVSASFPPAIACTAVLLAGCGNGRPAARAEASPDTAATGVMTAQPHDSLQLELIAPSRVRTGETVAFVLRARTPTARTMDVYLRGREPTMDVVVEGENGAVLWRRLENEVVPAIALLRALGRGESFEIRATWDQRTRAGQWVGPGRYRVRGVLLMEGAQRETDPTTLEIVAR